MEITQLGFSWMNEVEWSGEESSERTMMEESKSKEIRKSSTREEGRKADGSGSVCVFYIYDVCF